ncbi:MAG: response regulator [Bdellovibrionales bacterium]|nr:response regulator [Bdellovibrionales bacterium]
MRHTSPHPCLTAMRYTILVLDDDPSILAAVASELNSEEFNVMLASNVSEAAALFRQTPPDAAVVDLYLRGDYGDDLSNGFIRSFLHSDEGQMRIPYLRLTSAPSAVPPEYEGIGILDKRHFLAAPWELEHSLRRVLSPRRD